MTRTLLFAQFTTILFLATLHLFGVEYHLYWRFLWLDTIAHTLGGIWIAFFIAWSGSFFGYPPRLLLSVIAAFSIGACWEVFEYSVGVPVDINFAFDTSLDLLMDVFGGIIGYFIATTIVKSHASVKE